MMIISFIQKIENDIEINKDFFVRNRGVSKQSVETRDFPVEFPVLLRVLQAFEIDTPFCRE